MRSFIIVTFAIGNLIFCVAQVYNVRLEGNKCPQLRYKFQNRDGSRDKFDMKLDGVRYQVQNGADIDGDSRYNPYKHNIYHLYTRQNRNISQPLLIDNENLLHSSNFDGNKNVVVLIHGWLDSVTGSFNAVLVPAFLESEDLNVIVVDWSVGARTQDYVTAVANTVTSAEGVSRFIFWLNTKAKVPLKNYHLVGHSLGGHQVGMVGRHLKDEEQVGYITALDPSNAGWSNHAAKFRPSDGLYTEVIHTSVGRMGYTSPLGMADFYPNGGSNMPGCASEKCDHDRSFFYFAESIITGGFMARHCEDYLLALSINCDGYMEPMGGRLPKSTNGSFSLRTNDRPPFSIPDKAKLITQPGQSTPPTSPAASDDRQNFSDYDPPSNDYDYDSESPEK